MAASKLASNRRGRRNRARSTGHVRSDRLPIAVSSERRALMRADAVLRCVAAALEYDGWAADEPDYADAIAVASQLISQSIERLESRADLPTAGSVDSEPESST